jgi:homoserine kinase type II
MAVFTQVSLTQLQPWFEQFHLGTATAIHGIASGIENSNFFVETDKGHKYVLTLFERLSAAELPFYLNMMGHMASHQIACPNPMANNVGHILHQLQGKPAALVTCLSGAANMHPDASHCAEVGTALAKMHIAAQSYAGSLENLRGLSWWRQTAPKVQEFLDAEQQAMLIDEIATQTKFALSQTYSKLGKGAVHADLFRDNVLFNGTTLGGVIDFYFAGVDTYLFDLAVTINDWCINDASGAFIAAKYEAMKSAYCAVRPLSPQEIEAWPYMLRAAALRFWLSRLFDFYLPRQAALLTPKDPTHFERILRLRRADAHQDTQYANK